MAAKWQKWMPLHIDRFMGSRYVQAMHPSARAGYLYLIAAQWQSDDCTLSSEPEELAALSGLGDSWEDFSRVILRHFTSVDDRLRNDVCFEEWSEARVIHEKRWGAALRTNKARSESKETVSVRSAHGERAVSDTVSGTQYTGTGTDTDTETETIELISEAKASSPRTDSGKPDPIEEIYKAYPRKVGKQGAVKAITKAIQRVKSSGMQIREAEVYLFRRVQAYARSPAGNDGEFTPHPATWFNDGRYDDDPAQWQKLSGEKGKSNGNQGRNGFSGQEMSELLDSLSGSAADSTYGGS